MYDTCQLIAFLQQIITFDGFYDEALEFLRLERIQIVASINAATTVGRHPLSTRFTAVVRIGVVDYPDTNELVSVYDAFLGTVLGSVQLGDRKWVQPSERERLANTIVEVYQKTRYGADPHPDLAQFPCEFSVLLAILIPTTNFELAFNHSCLQMICLFDWLFASY